MEGADSVAPVFPAAAVCGNTQEAENDFGKSAYRAVATTGERRARTALRNVVCAAAGHLLAERTGRRACANAANTVRLGLCASPYETQPAAPRVAAGALPGIFSRCHCSPAARCVTFSTT